MKVRRLELRTGPEGAGKHRGGFGLRRDIQVLSDCVLSTCIDRSLIPPFGLFGGADGSSNLIFVARQGSDEWEPISPRLSNLPLKAGDSVRIETAIGGGFGDPSERDPELVADDVYDGYLTQEEAETTYGVAFNEDMTVNEESTIQRRSQPVHEPSTESGTETYPRREPGFRPLERASR